MGKRIDDAVNGRPHKTEDSAGSYDCESSNDRNGALAREEAKVTRKLDSIEAFENRRSNQAYDDASEDARLNRRNPHDAVGLDAAQFRAGAHGGEEDDISYCARHRGHAIKARFSKIALPAVVMICESQAGSHEKFALPTPSRMLATGNTETGNIMHLPTF